MEDVVLPNLAARVSANESKITALQNQEGLQSRVTNAEGSIATLDAAVENNSSAITALQNTQKTGYELYDGAERRVFQVTIPRQVLSDPGTYNLVTVPLPATPGQKRVFFVRSHVVALYEVDHVLYFSGRCGLIAKADGTYAVTNPATVYSGNSGGQTFAFGNGYDASGNYGLGIIKNDSVEPCTISGHIEFTEISNITTEGSM